MRLFCDESGIKIFAEDYRDDLYLATLIGLKKHGDFASAMMVDEEGGRYLSVRKQRRREESVPEEQEDGQLHPFRKAMGRLTS